jgi:hypothetical protein
VVFPDGISGSIAETCVGHPVEAVLAVVAVAVVAEVSGLRVASLSNDARAWTLARTKALPLDETVPVVGSTAPPCIQAAGVPLGGVGGASTYDREGSTLSVVRWNPVDRVGSAGRPHSGTTPGQHRSSTRSLMGEVGLVSPRWVHPCFSAVEVRAGGGVLSASDPHRATGTSAQRTPSSPLFRDGGVREEITRSREIPAVAAVFAVARQG